MTTNPIAALTTSLEKDGMDALWVSEGEATNLAILTHYEKDDRPLQHLQTLSDNVSDTLGSPKVDEPLTLFAREAVPQPPLTTLGQLVRELDLARQGEKSIFKKGQCYMLYLKGTDGTLLTVCVSWVEGNGAWGVWFYHYGESSPWHLTPGDKWCEGTQIIGN